MHTEFHAEAVDKLLAEVDAFIAANEPSVMASLTTLDDARDLADSSTPTTPEPSAPMHTESAHISIRVPAEIMNAFLRRAAVEATGYQTLMNRVLRKASETW